MHPPQSCNAEIGIDCEPPKVNNVSIKLCVCSSWENAWHIVAQ